MGGGVLPASVVLERHEGTLKTRACTERSAWARWTRFPLFLDTGVVAVDRRSCRVSSRIRILSQPFTHLGLAD